LVNIAFNLMKPTDEKFEYKIYFFIG